MAQAECPVSSTVNLPLPMDFRHINVCNTNVGITIYKYKYHREHWKACLLQQAVAVGQLRFSAEPKTTRNLNPKHNDPKSNCLSNFGIGQLHGCEPKVIFGTATHRLKKLAGIHFVGQPGAVCENHGARCSFPTKWQ